MSTNVRHLLDLFHCKAIIVLLSVLHMTVQFVFPPAIHGRKTGQQQSHELRVFQENYLTLHTGIRDNVQDLVRRSFSRDLLPDGVRRNITDTHDPQKKTDLLLSQLESSIKINPSVLMKFVDVLREADAVYYATLISPISKFDAAQWYYNINFTDIIIITACDSYSRCSFLEGCLTQSKKLPSSSRKRYFIFIFITTPGLIQL